MTSNMNWKQWTLETLRTHLEHFFNLPNHWSYKSRPYMEMLLIEHFSFQRTQCISYAVSLKKDFDQDMSTSWWNAGA